MSWLSDAELERVVQEHGDERTVAAFRGVFSINNMPTVLPKPPSFIIMNTDTTHLPGKHWKVLFIDKNYCGEIFDSLALPNCDYVTRFMNRHSRKWIRNALAYQHPLSSTCGAYALYFVMQRLHYDSLHDICKHFSHDTLVNEKRIRNFYKSLQ